MRHRSGGIYRLRPRYHLYRRRMALRVLSFTSFAETRTFTLFDGVDGADYMIYVGLGI